MKSLCVVAVAGDPGGAAAVAPVLAELRRRGVVVHAWAYAQAAHIWTAHGLAHTPLPEGPPQEVAARLQASGAEAVLVATSMNQAMWERAFTAAARAQGRPVLALLDFWTNYRGRFAGADGKLEDLPDVIAVMDEGAQAEMVAAGFPAARLRVTGQPAFDAWVADARAPRPVPADAPHVLFLSQPLREFYGDDPRAAGHPGYVQGDVLAALADVLANEAAARGARVDLTVRLHPKEDRATWAAPARPRLTVRVTGSEPLVDDLASADLVVGMTTVALVEAAGRGWPTLTVQPGAAGRDPLPAAAGRGLARCYALDQLAEQVRSLLFDEAARRALREQGASGRPPAGATGRVADLLETMLRAARAKEH